MICHVKDVAGVSHIVQGFRPDDPQDPYQLYDSATSKVSFLYIMSNFVILVPLHYLLEVLCCLVFYLFCNLPCLSEKDYEINKQINVESLKLVLWSEIMAQNIPVPNLLQVEGSCNFLFKVLLTARKYSPSQILLVSKLLLDLNLLKEQGM